MSRVQSGSQTSRTIWSCRRWERTVGNGGVKWRRESPPPGFSVHAGVELERSLRGAEKDGVPGLAAGIPLRVEDLPKLSEYLRGQGGAPLREVLRGSSLKWISGKKKKFTLSKEERKLQDARKASLYGRAAQSDYDQMVENVDTNLRAKNAAEAAAGATLKQASFGVHIIVGMIGGFAVGYMVSGNIGSGGAHNSIYRGSRWSCWHTYS